MFQKKATKCRSSSVYRNADGSISIRKSSSRQKNRSGNTKVATKKKNGLEGLIKLKSEVREGSVILDLPLRTISEANNFEHWTKKHKRHKAQQLLVATTLRPLKDKIKMPCKITLTRFAPHELDRFDNLPMSLKYIVDAVCAIITGNYMPGQADSDKRITLACDQIKCQEYGIRIEISF